ncbi:hypothetical protein [Bacillus paramycoides]|uniref:hypothetical protein n=1 Tax=Bacillus paramycoides TaxID=2026194 RepID=UPI002E1D5898|nr:hypothetical protein [Bacillus paramycoides]
MKKIILITVISLCLLYFMGGFIAVKFEFLSNEVYNSYVTLVGGIATICGLFAFTSPKLTTEDLENLEIESLKKITNLADDLNTKKFELNMKHTELTQLDAQKKEMELLVRKASLSLFLQDQFERNESRIIQILEQKQNEELLILLNEVSKNKDKLDILNEEIQQNEHVDLINEIIGRAKQKESSLKVILPVFPFSKSLEMVINAKLNEIRKSNQRM